MTGRVTNLQSSSAPQSPSPFADLIRLPGKLMCPDGVIFDALERDIRRHLFQTLLPSTMDEAERYLVLQGAPGIGKTVAACDASLRFGFAVALLPAALLASEHEGGATAVLTSYMRFVEEQSKALARRFAIVADDFDLSIVGNDAKTGRTINSNLLTQQLQTLADNRQYRNHDGTVIAIIFTGNDFTTVRASVFRDGRATWHTHAPTHDEKAQIAFKLLDPRTGEERRLVERLTHTYRNEPIAFWRSVKNDLVKALLDDVIALGLPNVSAAEAELTKRRLFHPQRLLAFAAARAKAGPRSFLS
jgi:hypothetical protein